MKRLLTILCLVLLVSCSNEVPDEELVERQGITYEVNSTTPFTGISISDYSNIERGVSREGFKNGLATGFKESFTQEGVLKYRYDSYIEDGERAVVSEYYYPNGQLEDRTHYFSKKGEVDSLISNESYYENGQLWYKTNNLTGHGESYHRNGQLACGPLDNNISICYHPNGELKEKGMILNREKTGLWESFDENGNPTKTERYKDGELIE
jgi:antitoxin component YwqK of YwqJK toxin-antitoxin module